MRRARSWPPIWSVSSTARPSTDIKLDTNGMPGCGLRQDPLVDRSGEQDPWSGLVEQPRPRVPVVGPLRRRSAGPPTELGSRPTLWATGTAQGPTTARGRSTTSWGAGINTSGKVGNTGTMFSDLPAWRFREVAATVQKATIRFDMASRQDLAEVFNDVLHRDEGLTRQCIHRVLQEERFNCEGNGQRESSWRNNHDRARGRMGSREHRWSESADRELGSADHGPESPGGGAEGRNVSND